MYKTRYRLCSLASKPNKSHKTCSEVSEGDCRLWDFFHEVGVSRSTPCMVFLSIVNAIDCGDHHQNVSQYHVLEEFFSCASFTNSILQYKSNV